jgi:hypothetical protein
MMRSNSLSRASLFVRASLPLAAACCLALCSLATAIAQEPEPKPPMPTPEDVAAAEGKKDTPLREQTIYIPYAKLRSLFEKEGRGVFLP